jgi:ketosteroid isomerase-like protein
MDRDEALEVLLAEREIRNAIAQYARGVDRQDEELVRSTYHEDATDNHGYTVVESGFDLAALVNPNNPNSFPDEWAITHHFIGNTLIEVDGDRAASETYHVATMRADHDGRRYDLTVFGRYVDRWERRDGGPFKVSERIVVHDAIRTEDVRIWPGPDTDVPKMYFGGPALPADDVVHGRPAPEDVSYSVLGDNVVPVSTSSS